MLPWGVLKWRDYCIVFWCFYAVFEIFFFFWNVSVSYVKNQIKYVSKLFDLRPPQELDSLQSWVVWFLGFHFVCWAVERVTVKQVDCFLNIQRKLSWETWCKRPPVMKDQTFLPEGSIFQCNWTCHQRPPVLKDHIFGQLGGLPRQVLL